MKTTFVLHFAGAAVVLLCASTTMAAEPKADALLKEIGSKRGLCVVLGEQPTQLALDLARASELTLYVQSPRAEDAAAMRKTLDAAGLLGTRVYVEPGAWSRIHLADNLADAVIVTGSARDTKHAPAAELVRVLRPRGKLIGLAQTMIKPVPPGTGEWTHPYHSPDNNPQAEDQLARAPFLTRFLATPFYGPMPEVTVASGGIVFKAFGYISFKKREWPMLNKLIALNGYNGTILWERDLKPGFMIHRNTMVATPDTLYLADDDSCKLIEPATGRVKDQIVLSPEIADGPCWKWMTLENGVLYVLAGEREQAEEVLHGERTHSGWPWNALGKGYASKDYPWGFGKTLLAIDPATKKVLWKRSEPEAIDSRATTMKNGRIFIYSHQKHLTAVNASNGDNYWKTADAQLLQAIGEHDRAQDPRKGYSTTVYLKSGEKALYFSGPQRHSLVAVSVDDGRMLWSYPHGNYQLVIRDDALYAMGRTDVSRKFDPLTGKILAELDCVRGNCTRATGTADSIFARGDSHGGTLRLSVANNEPHRFPAMRPGCQDGVIAANGLLYWGPWMCDCNHSLVGIISLGPAGKFDFTQPAVERERLETAASGSKAVAAFPLSPNDWPTYRANNLRTAHLPVAVPAKARPLWQYQPKQESEPTAPVIAGGLAFVSGADGVVRAFDAASGRPRWTAYTGGAVQYPPTIANDRAYVGSGDGWVYCFEAATGRQLWRFRAAPVERKMPVYGRLLSTWPVASGVLVENGVAYAAAGIVSHDGTHVYALDAATGKIKWQNNTSGNLMGEGVVVGVSVQGHMLLNDGKLYLAGGNVVSPAIYDLRDGRCLNTLTNEWQKGPRGSELFFADGEVRVVDKMMYSPRDYIPSRYFAKYLVQASSSDLLIQGTEHEMMRVDLKPGPDGRPKVIWKDSRFVETSGVVLGQNAVLIIGRVEGRTKEAAPVNVLLALNPQDGSTLWAVPLPAAPKTWGLAVDRDGRIIVTLVDGRVLCYAG